MSRYFKFLLFPVIFLLFFSPCLYASYTVNGTASVIGRYGYDGDNNLGETGHPYRSFSNGKLMDGSSSSGIAFPQDNSNVYDRYIWFDMGQVQHLESLTVRAVLGGWDLLPSADIAFSTDGVTWSFPYIKQSGEPHENVWPHAPLSPVKAVDVSGISARYIRFRYMITQWTNSKIGEIDIAASSPSPLASLFAVDDLQNIIEAWNSTPSIDRFGQWNKDDWPNKVHSEAELISKMDAEIAKYTVNDYDPAKFDQYGGCKTLGIQSTADGKWRTEKIDGKWWFITPEGWPFLMKAVDATHSWGLSTVENPLDPDLAGEFTGLPARSDPTYADCWEDWPWNGTTVTRFDFFEANLIRYYGGTYWTRLPQYCDLLRKRLLDWGFNSSGKWAGGEVDYIDMPFVKVLSPSNPAVPILGTNRGWCPEDPWVSYFGDAVKNAIVYAKNEWGSNPFYMGPCVANEGWWDDNTTTFVLQSNSSVAAKVAFVDQLETTYTTVANLNSNTGCGMGYTTWSELDNANLSAYKSCLSSDISDFIVASSERYYSTWREKMDQYDPDHILFGSSFVLWWLCSPEWIQGSASYVDVMMLDFKTADPNWVIDNYVEPFAVPVDKPVVVAEFYILTTERGFKEYLAENQQQRGEIYRNLVETLYAHPNWIGSMWFQYRDFPLLGIDAGGYGEAANHGLVDTCNLPYDDFIDGVRAGNQDLYRIHLDVPVNCDDIWAAGLGNSADLDKNCYIDISDFALMTLDWMRCNDPLDSECEANWPTE